MGTAEAFFPPRSILPNSLTLIRLVLAVLLPFLPPDMWWPIFVVAFATEFLDGFLSRALSAGSEFGRIADPIADKAFVFALLVVLLLDDRLPLVHLVLIGIRDEAVLLGALAVLARGGARGLLCLKPSAVGKTATVFQFVYIGWLLREGPPPIWLLSLVTGASLIAGLDYVVRHRDLVAPGRPSGRGAA